MRPAHILYAQNNNAVACGSNVAFRLVNAKVSVLAIFVNTTTTALPTSTLAALAFNAWLCT